jgi:hypothetical protein
MRNEVDTFRLIKTGDLLNNEEYLETSNDD